MWCAVYIGGHNSIIEGAGANGMGVEGVSAVVTGAAHFA